MDISEILSCPCVPIVLGAIGLSAVVCGLTLLWAASMYRDIKSKCRSDADFVNGGSLGFSLRLALEGFSVDNVFKVMNETVRNRLYASVKTSMFSSQEIWLVGHPAIVKEVFGPGTAKNWVKEDQAETNRLLTGKHSKKTENKAMLYTGDDSGWKHARQLMTPFFYKKDFTAFDKDMDRVIQKHLDKACKETSGNKELLNLTLTITIDMVVQCLYGIELPEDQFNSLVKSLAGYIVPGSPALAAGKLNLPGNMSPFEYHRKVGFDIGRKAPKGTLMNIIADSDLPENLKDENLAFFLEALTPAFASFWVICHALIDKTGEMAAKQKEDPVYRQQCIKEALRMYPPVPSLWPRTAQKDLEIPNPLYDDTTPPKKKGFFGKEPIENSKTIKIKKGTVAMVFPSALHYDERFWFAPKEYSPERWDKDPFVLEMKTDVQTIKISSRKTVNYGGLLSNVTEEINTKSRDKLLADGQKFYESQHKWESNIRNYMFGDDHEKFMADSSYGHLTVCTDPAVFDHNQWSFMPFGLGMHACMGRRLALRMVDAILYNFLEYDVTFYGGLVPSMFTSKDYHERIVATAAVYNMPADPAYVSLKAPKKSVDFKDKAKLRVSVVDHVELRKSGIKSKKLSDLLRDAMLEDDDDSSDDEN